MLSVKRSIAHLRHTLLASRLREAVEAGMAQCVTGTAAQGASGGSGVARSSGAGGDLLRGLAVFYSLLGLDEALVALDSHSSAPTGPSTL
jgi:hypothetical protein